LTTRHRAEITRIKTVIAIVAHHEISGRREPAPARRCASLEPRANFRCAFSAFELVIIRVIRVSQPNIHFEIDRFFLFSDNVIMTRIALNNFKPTASLIILMSFLGAFSLCCADQVITVSGKTFTLIDSDKLTSKRAVKRVKTNADSAIAAVAASARKAEDDGKAIKARLDTYAQSVEARRKKFAAYGKEKEAYVDEVNHHNEDVAQYTQQLTEHNQRVEASNALKPENRDEATVKALSAEVEKLSNWVAKLSYDTTALDTKTSALLKQKNELHDEVKLFLDESKVFAAEVKTNLTAMDEACRQLQLCCNYVQQINPLLEKYHIKPAPQDDARMSGYAKSLDEVKALKTLVESNAIIFNLQF
jgi:Skp family chaperone for outer membrane proteins